MNLPIRNALVLTSAVLLCACLELNDDLPSCDDETAKPPSCTRQVNDAAADSPTTTLPPIGGSEAGNELDARTTSGPDAAAAEVSSPSAMDSAFEALSICGDNKVDPNEVCDEGVNNVPHDWSQTPPPAGRPPPRGLGLCFGCRTVSQWCGDGVANSPFEDCDAGPNGKPATGSEMGCDSACKRLLPLSPPGSRLDPILITNAKCPFVNDDCLAKLKGGQTIEISCKDVGNSTVTFPPLDAAPMNGLVIIELGGGSAGVWLKCGNGISFPEIGGVEQVVPRACWENNQAISLHFENPSSGGCLTLEKARLRKGP